MRCAACNHDNPDQARFCAQCGSKLAAACPACAAPVAADQKFCSACGQALMLARPESEPVATAAAVDAGERRYATIVFSDLSGFTALNERLDPEEVETIMGRVKSEATTIIERHGGTVNQFVGDEVYSVFGVPQARRDDPERAVRAALELHRAVQQISADVLLATGQPLVMHSGIHTGLVLARTSESHAGRYLLTGDTVNTAARLLQVAQPGEVVVSPETWRQVSEIFEGAAGEPVALKGKALPLVPHRILGERLARSSARPFVGRAEEMRQLGALAQSCLEHGRGRVVVLRGDPGMGKTRLALELLTMAASLGFTCHRALVLDFGASTGRDAVRSLVQSLLGVDPQMGEDQRRDAVARALEQGLIGAAREALLYDLVDVLPPPASHVLLGAMSVTARQRGTLEALGELVSNASRRRPLVLLVEDIHWADPETLERLSALAACAAGSALLFALTTRFEGDPTTGPWRGALRGVPTSAIDLGPLAADDAALLAFGVSQMPESVMRTCVERAEGNPLFLEQLLLNAEGAVLEQLPGTIQALVLSRMDRLETRDKLALQAAAILGQRFALDALRHVIEDPRYDCADLVGHYLVRPEGAEFLFCHALIRDGARESLAKARRRQLHARAADWFDSRDPALAAEHHERAASPQAAHAYALACEAKAAQFRYDEALALAERGLALATQRQDRFALMSARARLLLELGRAQEAIEAGRAAYDCAEGGAECAAVLAGMAAGMRINDRFDEGLAALEQAQPMAEQSGDALLLAQLHHLRGNLYFPLGRIDDCVREHHASLAHARRAGSLEAEARALGGLGDAHYLGGRMRSSHEQFVRCVALCRQHGFGRLEVTVLSMVGWTASYLNDLGTACEHGKQAAQLAARVSHPRSEVLARLLIGHVEGTLRSDFDTAKQELELALALAGTLGAKRFQAQALHLLAVVAMRQGERGTAQRLAAQALAICQEHGMGFIGASVYGLLATLADHDQARALALAEGEKVLAAGSVSHNHLTFYARAIDVCLAAGHWDAARSYGAKLRAYAAAEPLPWTEFMLARGEALVRAGQGERGSALAGQLRDLCTQATSAELDDARPALEAALREFDPA